MTVDEGVVEAWPFLVAAGRTTGAAVRAAPAMLLDSNDENALLAPELGKTSEADKPIPFLEPGGRQLWMVAVERDGVDPSGAPVRDHGGRLITIVCGLVAASSQLSKGDLTPAVLEQLDGLYHRWLADETAGPFATQAHHVQALVATERVAPVPPGSDSGKTEEVERVDPVPQPPPRSWPPLVVGLAALLMGLVLGYLVGRQGAPEPGVLSCGMDSSGVVAAVVENLDTASSADLRLVVEYLDADGRSVGAATAVVDPDAAHATVVVASEAPAGARSVSCGFVALDAKQ